LCHNKSSILRKLSVRQDDTFNTIGVASMTKVNPEQNGHAASGIGGNGYLDGLRRVFDEPSPTFQYTMPQSGGGSAVTLPAPMFGKVSALEHLTYAGNGQENILDRFLSRYNVPRTQLYEAAAYLVTIKFRQEALAVGSRKRIRVTKMVSTFVETMRESANRTNPFLKSIADIMLIAVTLQPPEDAMIRLNQVRSSLNQELDGCTVADFSVRSVGKAQTHRDETQLTRLDRELKAGNDLIRELSSEHQLPSLEVLPAVVTEITEPILHQMLPLLEKFIDLSRAKHGSNTSRFISDLASVIALASYQVANVATVKLFRENGVYDAEKLNFSDTFILSYWRRFVLIQLIPLMRKHGVTMENIQPHIAAVRDFDLHDDAAGDDHGRSLYTLMNRAMGMMALTEEIPHFIGEDDTLRNSRVALSRASLFDHHPMHTVAAYTPANLLVLPVLDSVDGNLGIQCTSPAEDFRFNMYVPGEVIRFKTYSNAQLRVGGGRMGLSFWRYLTTPSSPEDRAIVDAFTEEQHKVRSFVAKLQTEYPALFNPNASWAPLIVVCHPDGPIVLAKRDDDVLLSIPLKDLSLISEDDLSWGPIAQLIDRRHAAFYLDKFSSPKRKAMMAQVQHEREETVVVKTPTITHDTMHRLGLFFCYDPARGDENKTLLTYSAPLLRVGNKSEFFELDVTLEALQNKQVDLGIIGEPKNTTLQEKNCAVVLLTGARQSFDEIPDDTRKQVVRRFQAISEKGHFGDVKNIANARVSNLKELTVGGYRVYFWRIGMCCVVSKIGSKAEQSRDVARALKDQILAQQAADAAVEFLASC
jgi:putative component of toxin-antitoxin plasmid stabilization module